MGGEFGFSSQIPKPHPCPRGGSGGIILIGASGMWQSSLRA